MSHLCHICQLPFTRGYNLRRHIERVHKHGHGDLEMYGGGSKTGEGKRHHDSSDEGSYDDISESDTNDSSSEPLEEDDMTDSSETDDSDAESDTEGADSSEEESAEDDVVYVFISTVLLIHKPTPSLFPFPYS
ncbi:hypothetical protein HOLleu_16058 [Holothuria leucospilota]|uniref:C2H2-type domain-containing protein n=1 Tax=Holothuria leucospilota TaxID=206669 RepID=A0A9Q1HAD1_HOLLE|nr:hypothetical protein HOLleu_16058 [Holothuria leucospilota]